MWQSKADVLGVVGSALQIFKEVPNLCSVLSYCRVPWEDGHVHSGTCLLACTIFNLWEGMKVQRRHAPSLKAWAPEAWLLALLHCTGQCHPTIRVAGACSLGLCSGRTGNGFGETDGTLHHLFPFSAPESFLFSNIKTPHPARKCIFLSPSLFTPLSLLKNSKNTH